VTMGNESAEYPSCRMVPLDPRPQLSRHVDPCSLASHRPLAEASELLPRTRHCQVLIFGHTASALLRGLSAHMTPPVGLHEFYAPSDALGNYGELDFWDSCHTLQRAHFGPYRIAENTCASLFRDPMDSEQVGRRSS